MHAISGMTKAMSSWFAIHAIAECRQILGGHGYSAYSRLGKLFHDNDVITTWEGDNHMLLQQTTKYILKSVSKIQNNKMFDHSILLFLKETIEVDENVTQTQIRDIKFLKNVLQARISTIAQ